MEYYIGVDGGATKTLAVIGDCSGRILGTGLSGPSNYQVFGLEIAMESVREAIVAAATAAGIGGDALAERPGAAAAGAVFGLAGADFPVDFERLTEGVQGLMGGRPFRVVNDCWVALRGGTPASFGIVAINGSGPNFAGRNRKGEQCINRGMGYEVGNRGGAADIMRDALHHAFRADEGAGPATALTEAIPRVVGLPSLQAIAEAMYAGGVGPAMGQPVVPLVFELANQGDAVAQRVLIDIGEVMGQSAGGVAKRLGMADEEFDVVLAGSVWRGVNPLLRDQFTTALHRVAPRAMPRLPLCEPGIGAYLMALEDGGVAVTESIISQVAASWSLPR